MDLADKLNSKIMHVPESTACAQVSPDFAIENHERVRAYEIAAYLSAASFPFGIADGPPANPVPSSDLTLNALVQHGTYAMDCDRAFLSLIDNRSQSICAEMTQNQSLAKQNPSQPLLLGTSRIPLEWGVCPYTMSVFHGKTEMIPETPYIVADPSYFYIKDFRLVPLFAARPYVAGYPNMVSYIEVPLRSPSGHILGSYCVVDNKSRDFLEPTLLKTLREAASAISSYLDMKRAEVNRTRSERMMNSLSNFIASERRIHCSGSSDTRSSKIPAGPFELNLFRQSSRTSPSSGTDETTSPEKLPCLSASECNARTLVDDPHSRPVASDPGPESSEISSKGSLECMPKAPGTFDSARSERRTTHSFNDIPRSFTLNQQSKLPRSRPDLSCQINNLFARAATTIGFALAVDGLVFFDAITTSTSYHRSRASSLFATKESPGPTAHGEDLAAVVLSEYQGGQGAERHLIRKPNQSTIKRLTTRYPQGHVFVMDEYGVLDYSADHQVHTNSHPTHIPVADNEQKDILECVPKARYAIFLPLWHYQRESCFATCLVWVSDSAKTLDTGDINSLTAFGNSLMIEILRLEASTIVQSKSDFISSISHELRSPLHGIVATTELMQEILVDPYLLSMMDMIGLCSTTLLDTFDHLLEFAKINSHTKGAQSNISTPRPYDASETQSVIMDLGQLLEEVVEVASLGHFQALQMNLGLHKEQEKAHNDQANLASFKPVLVMTCLQRCNWLLPIRIGAWKRILLNILSNALKYTKSGYIDLSLRMSEVSCSSSRCISLCVTDTGVGMSPEFLKYHLFTPFMQENHLSPGTGLGLSLVKSIVESLEGSISVESRKGMGTCVTINVPINEGSKNSKMSEPSLKMDVPKAQNDPQSQSLCLVSITLLEKGLSKTIPHTVPSPKVLQRAIHNICEGKCSIHVVEYSEGSIPNADIVVLDTSALTENVDLSHLFAGLTTLPMVIALGTTKNGLAQCPGIRELTYHKSPITGKKLLAALLKAQTVRNRSLVSPLQDPSYRVKQTPMEHTHLEATSDSASSGLASQSLETPRSTLLPVISSHKTIAPTSVPSLAVTSRFKRFLLVDDNPINLKLLVEFITRINRPFSTATDGAEAVRLYQQAASEECFPFDCIFMDISMPVMDGFQATAAIRQFERTHSHNVHGDAYEDVLKSALQAYIFALTGLGSDDARTAARVSGVDAFLLKPVKFKDIVPLLSR